MQVKLKRIEKVIGGKGTSWVDLEEEEVVRHYWSEIEKHTGETD